MFIICYFYAFQSFMCFRCKIGAVLESLYDIDIYLPIYLSVYLSVLSMSVISVHQVQHVEKLKK